MSDFRVISGVTKSFGAFLKASTGIDVDTDKAPSDTIADTTPLIHVYLYRVEYSPFWMNGDEVVSSPTLLTGPPVGLNLFYLITPYGPGQTNLQLTLGKVINVINDSPSVPPTDPSLAGIVEELKIIPHMLSLDQMTELSRVFGQRHYRLSVTYEVAVALIDSTVTQRVQRVEERHVAMRQLR